MKKTNSAPPSANDQTFFIQEYADIYNTLPIHYIKYIHLLPVDILSVNSCLTSNVDRINQEPVLLQLFL